MEFTSEIKGLPLFCATNTYLMVVVCSVFRYFGSCAYRPTSTFREHEKMKDSTADAIATVLIIMIVVTTAVFWVSHQ